ncbi:DUF3152 domain-containing protein [Actinacidiphila acidipaludis]|uniref:DUF3152 domain-containing protein n=1 Tax=Actinacidiphila acidipaludis TaxID=2873382 RepID=UPI0027DED98A|nr:DUF3152 domain-containing protein [Streptomyces acidipaludis]
MGKHSASEGTGGQSGAGGRASSPGPHRTPPPVGAPGTGRRRRGDADADTGGFAVVRPREAGGPPQAHPEHREHAAWGASGGWPAGRAGVPGRRRDLLPDPVEEWAADWAPYDTAAALRPPAATAGRPLAAPQGRLVPRPRQEFVDAFDAPVAATAPAAASARMAAGGDGEHPGDGDGGRRGGGKGRAISGAAAAAVVTVLAVVVGGQATGGGRHPTGSGGNPGPDGGARSTAGEASRSQARSSDAPAAAPSYDELMARQYPLDPKLALSGAFTTVPGHQAAPGRGKVLKFRVDVEQGLELDARLFSDAVFATLNDPRSWGHGGTMTFERVSSGPADIVVTLASPGTTAKWCAKSGLDTSVENVSCDSASTPRTMINAYRWAQGAVTYGPERMLAYRQMLINHEVGHRLGHDHVGCPKEGAPAPVMMQQTKFLSLDGGPTCKPNAWPFP